MFTIITDGFTLHGCIAPRGQLHGELHFDYRPAPPEASYSYLKAVAGKDGKQMMKMVVGLLKKHLITWNCVDQHGCEVSITDANLERVPHVVLDAMVDYVLGYTYPERECSEKN